MIVEWTQEALDDVERLYSFLAAVDDVAAKEVVDRLEAAPAKLLLYPRIGARLDGFNSREVRKIAIGKYEIRLKFWGK